VEVVGGNANSIELSIFGEGQQVVGPESSKNFIQLRTRSFPVTMSTGDIVKIQNTIAARRTSRLTADDSISVAGISSTNFEYRWNPKTTNLGEFVRFTISDVSASYGRPAGVVWRWTHNDGGSSFSVVDDNVGAVANPPDDEV